MGSPPISSNGSQEPSKESRRSGSHCIAEKISSKQEPVCSTTEMAAADSPGLATNVRPSSAVPVSERDLDVTDIIDLSTFEQIREMDDDDSDDFSRAIVMGFLEQADETFTKMDLSLQEKDLVQLSSLGHFLKGSSATLGLLKVKDLCEAIQHYGGRKDETGTRDMPDDEICLQAIETALTQMRDEYSKVRTYFFSMYPEEIPEGPAGTVEGNAQDL